MKKVSLVYFQHDLRIRDHRGLSLASKSGYPIIAVYLMNPIDGEPTRWGFVKMGVYRRTFLSESLIALKKNLASLHIPLMVFKDAVVAANSIKLTYQVEGMYAAIEPGSEEQALARQLQSGLGLRTINTYHDKPLLSPDHYPWLLTALPGRFTDARLKIESSIKVDSIQPTIQPQAAIDGVKDDWDVVTTFSNAKTPFMHGGEEEAIRHLNDYFFQSRHVLTYKETRNAMLRFEDSSKLSPALALGLLSPRTIYWELKKVEATIEKNQSTYWLWFELLWRDYFYYLHLTKGNRFFSSDGIMGVQKRWQMRPDFLDAVLHAKTGYPLVDANLTELYQTGWMSNRGRQNVASFISKILQLDWRWGASLFEHYLIDYDVSSNYGNWQYVSGVGVDPREDRIFNVSLQAKKYDPNGAYIKHWLPALRLLPTPILFEPWKMNPLDMAMYQCEIGKDYPRPIIVDRRVQLND